MLSYEPALTAASALFLSMNIIKKGKADWTQEIEQKTGYSKMQLRDCAEDLVILLSGIKGCSLKMIGCKFSSAKYNKVYTIPLNIQCE